MIEFDGDTLSAITFLSCCQSEWKSFAQIVSAGHALPPNPSQETRAQFLRSLQIIEGTAESLEMQAVAVTAKKAFEQCLNLLSANGALGSHELHILINHIHSVLIPFVNGLSSTRLLQMSPKHSMLYNAEDMFGTAVTDAFPSAAFDIQEAGNCMALGRWTAAVMHSMRALEVGLKALGQKFEVPTEQNWNNVLNQIEKALKNVNKRDDGADQESWASEAAIHLRLVKNAWRNHAMHPHEKYDESRATVILGHARDFLQQLSKHVNEQ